MRRVVLVLGVILVVVAAFLSVLGPGRIPNYPDAEWAARPTKPSPEAPVATQVETVAPVTTEAPTVAAISAIDVEVDPDDRSAPRSRLFGRVTDVRAAPLCDVAVRLSCHGRWVSAEIHADEIPSHYDATTDASGRFEFDVLTPTSGWVSLTIQGGPYLSKTGRDFGLAGGRNQAPVRPGDNDVGVFVLDDAGAIAGRVTDTRGAPVEGAVISLTSSHPGGYSISGITDAEGRYALGQLPAGAHVFGARRDGFLIRHVGGIEVDIGQTASAVDFVLDDAAFISGRIVDQEVEPIGGARLWGWPHSGGRGAGGRSDEHGRFRIYLPQHEPYSLGVGVEGYEDIPDRGVEYEPGSTDILLVMQRASLSTFLVRDRITGSAVERFGMKLIQVRTERGGTTGSSTHREPAPLGRYEGGVVLLPGKPKLCDYVIDAPGYGAQRGVVSLDADGRQIILLDPEARVAGRLVVGGKPVASPTVRVERAPVSPDPNDPDQPVDSFDADAWNLDEYTGRVRLMTGDADGTFSIEGLCAGTYKLTVTGSDSGPVVLRGMRLESGRTRDLGDLAGYAPGSITGVVVVATGHSPGGLSIVLDGDDERAIVTDLSGRFRFDGVGVGSHGIDAEEKPGLVVPGPDLQVELGPGEHKQVVLDLTARAPVHVTVRVTAGGAPLRGTLVLSETPDANGDVITERRLGHTDAAGLVSAWVPAAAGTRFLVRSDLSVPLAASRVYDTSPAGKLEVAVGIDVGGLRVQLPVGVAPDEAHSVLFLVIADGQHHPLFPTWVVVDNIHTFDIEMLAAGRYEVRFFVGSMPMSADVEVSAGETTIARLAP